MERRNLNHTKLKIDTDACVKVGLHGIYAICYRENVNSVVAAVHV